MGNIIIYILIFSVIPLIFALGSHRNSKQAAEYMKKKNDAKPENTAAPNTRGKTESNTDAKSPRTVVNPQTGIFGSQPERKTSSNPPLDYDMPSKGKQEDEYMKKKNDAKPENASASNTRGKIESNNDAKSPRTVENLRPSIVGSQPEKKIAREPWPYYNVPPMMRPAGEEYRTGGDEEELRW